MPIELPRRRFLAGLGALIAAPAIVRASSLMPVRGWKPLLEEPEKWIYGTAGTNQLLTINMITREVVRLFKRSNAYMQQIDAEYETLYGGDLRIGQQLRIRMLNNFRTK